MGDSPEVVKIACPGCETQFRLKPKKGRLPRGPVPCPKCAESIPVVEKNILRKSFKKKKTSAPRVHAFQKNVAPQKDTKQDDTNKSGTLAGRHPNPTPHHVNAVEHDVQADEDDEFDHISAAPGLSNSDPKSTFLGMGSALAAIPGPGETNKKAKQDDDDGPKHRGDKTAVVDGEVLAQIRSESSVVEDDEDESDSDPLRQTAENKALLRETSEKPAAKPDEDDAEAASESAPGHQVIGKIKLKKKLARRLRKNKASNEDGDSDEKTKAKKPSLASLLKKARDRKDKAKTDHKADEPNEDIASAADKNADRSHEEFDQALDDLADETARALTAEDKESTSDKQPARDDEPKDDLGATAPADKDFVQPSGFDSGDSSMIDMMRRRVAENQQPGAASERRGSGYIRLPTAEIQDVLGQGSYRLRVEDIVYEPIDKEGLTQLVKRGVLLGAEQIADADGDWMPITEHPVFHELRRKMAREAHELLAQYGKPAESGEDEKSDLPTPLKGARNADLPAPADVDLPTSLGSDAAEPDAAETDAAADEQLDESSIPTLDAELDEEAQEAARDLFSEAEDIGQKRPNEDFEESLVADGGAKVPPPMPRPSEPSEPSKPSEPSDQTSTEVPSLATTTPEADLPAADEKRSKLRTWLPIAVAAGVVAVLAVAISPIGQPVVDRIMTAAGGDVAEDEPADDEASATDDTDDDAVDIGEAVAAASSTLGEASAVDTSDATLQQSVADELLEAGEHPRAARVLGAMWTQRQDDAALTERLVRTLLEAGRHAKARQIALEGIQLDSNEHDFASLYKRAITEDPQLAAYEVVDLSVGEHADVARASLEGKRVVLHLDQADEHRYTFKPSQSGWESGWRASIATWRLCQLMACKFEVPSSQPARIDKESFDKLAASGEAVGQLSSLNWQNEDGNQYVYGVLHEAVDEPARFPIEYLDLWRSWLSAGTSTDFDGTSLSEALSPLESLSGEFYEPILSHVDDQTFSAVAGQLSSVLVVDFLTNNWARFSRSEENWGEGLHFTSNGIVSLDNGDAFQPRASTRIKGRFSWTDRFSKDLVTSLRLMERAMVMERLFPQPTAGEKARLEVFWNQRQRALDRIDDLSITHGEKEVLAFE